RKKLLLIVYAALPCREAHAQGSHRRVNGSSNRNCAEGRLDRANRIQICGDIQTVVSDIHPHLELLGTGHAFGAEFRVLQARVANKEPRVVICESPGWRALDRGVRGQIDW